MFNSSCPSQTFEKVYMYRHDLAHQDITQRDTTYHDTKWHDRTQHDKTIIYRYSRSTKENTKNNCIALSINMLDANGGTENFTYVYAESNTIARVVGA